MSELCPCNPRHTASFEALFDANNQGTSAVFRAVRFTPKAEVTGSNPVGCTKFLLYINRLHWPPFVLFELLAQYLHSNNKMKEK